MPKPTWPRIAKTSSCPFLYRTSNVSRSRPTAWATNVSRTSIHPRSLSKPGGWSDWFRELTLIVAHHSPPLRRLADVRRNGGRELPHRGRTVRRFAPDPLEIDASVPVSHTVAERCHACHAAAEIGLDHAVPRNELEALRIRRSDPPTLVGGDMECDVGCLLESDHQAERECVLPIHVCTELVHRRGSAAFHALHVLPQRGELGQDQRRVGHRVRACSISLRLKTSP